jgi:hypothetical protein
VAYLLVVSATFPPVPVCSGVYHDRFRRVDGRWLFSERVLTMDGEAELAAATAAAGGSAPSAS